MIKLAVPLLLCLVWQSTSGEIFKYHNGIIGGRPGEDYPIYNEVPSTSFSCLNQKYEGIYADVETNCQVFHMCQPKGHTNSFLCPNGTIFNQKYFICDWWFNVECQSSDSYYDLNSKIYETPTKNLDNSLEEKKQRSLDIDNSRSSNDFQNNNQEVVKRVEVTKAPEILRPTISNFQRNPASRVVNNRGTIRANRLNVQNPEVPATRAKPITVEARKPFERKPALRVVNNRGTVRINRIKAEAPEVPATRTEPITVRNRRPAAKVSVARKPVVNLRNRNSFQSFGRRIENNNPFIVAPQARDPNEVKIITEPTPRPINVGQALRVQIPRTGAFATRDDGRERNVPIVIPRQNIQIFPIGVGQTPNRSPVERPPQNSFEDILDVELNKTPIGRSRVEDEIEEILQSFPGPRRLR